MNRDYAEAKRLVQAVIDGSAREMDVKKLAHETMAIVAELERTHNGLCVEQDIHCASDDIIAAPPTLGATAVQTSFEQPLDNLNAILAEVDRRCPVSQLPMTVKTEPFFWDSDRLAATVARELRQMIAGASLRLPSEADVARFLCDVSFGAGAYEEMSGTVHDARPGVFDECKREARLLLGFIQSRSLMANDATITETERITMKNDRDRALARLRAWEIATGETQPRIVKGKLEQITTLPVEEDIAEVRKEAERLSKQAYNDDGDGTDKAWVWRGGFVSGFMARARRERQPSAKAPPKILSALVVAGYPMVIDTIAEELREAGISNIVTATSLDEAKRAFIVPSYDIAVLDNTFPRTRGKFERLGIELAEWIRSSSPTMPIAIYTGEALKLFANDAKRLNVKLIEKSFHTYMPIAAWAKDMLRNKPARYSAELECELPADMLSATWVEPNVVGPSTSSPPQTLRALVVAGHVEIIDIINAQLRKVGIREIVIATSFEKAKNAWIAPSYDIVIINNYLQHKSGRFEHRGIEVAEWIRFHSPTIPIAIWGGNELRLIERDAKTLVVKLVEKDFDGSGEPIATWAEDMLRIKLASLCDTECECPAESPSNDRCGGGWIRCNAGLRAQARRREAQAQPKTP